MIDFEACSDCPRACVRNIDNYLYSSNFVVRDAAKHSFNLLRLGVAEKPGPILATDTDAEGTAYGPTCCNENASPADLAILSALNATQEDLYGAVSLV